MAQTTYQMLFPDTCPKDICNQLASMHKNEGWQSTASSLAINHPHFIALKTDDDSIVATSSVSYINDRNTWVGNVYVKENHRRKGLASRLMKQLRNYIVDKGQAHMITLLSVPEAIPLYKTLGYSTISSTCAMIYGEKIQSVRIGCFEDCKLATTEEMHGSAISLFEEITNQDRGFVIKNIVKMGGICAMAMDENGEVIASAWGRRLDETQNESHDRRELLLGPIVGKTVEAAFRACSMVVRHDLDDRMTVDGVEQDYYVLINALDKTSDHSGIQLCDALRLKFYEKMTYMALTANQGISKVDDASLKEAFLDLNACEPGYYGLIGWSMS